MDHLSGLLAFVHAVEARSFTRAARRLGISPSGISKAISRLESRHGVRLLQRTARSISLTPEGLAYYQLCKKIVADLEEAEHVLTDAHKSPRGLLRITLPLSIARLHFARMLPEFARQYSEVQLEVHVSDRITDLVEEKFDVAIRIGKLSDSRLVARRLASGTLTTCATPSYLKRHGVPKRPEDLLQHNCIQFEVPNTGRAQPWQFQRDQRRLSVPVRGNLRLDHAEAMVEAALAGTALIQISSYVTAPAIARRQLEPILTAYQVDSPPIWALYPKNSNPTPRLKAFVDFMVRWGALSNLGSPTLQR
ncbi:MAG TPA: LysR family transcriptional regulator [Steroidobacteraceae bacterium]|nr:LysR family transcriptional regulator [Steroidobacteraceae bacterium]